jgi:hypothetical protein
MQIHKHLHTQDTKQRHAAQQQAASTHTENTQEDGSDGGSGSGSGSILDSILGGEELYESGRMRKSHGMHNDEGVSVHVCV